MRLPVPFVRLPLRVDPVALAAEVTALPESIWKAHPEGAAGNTAVPLFAVGGDPANDTTRGPIRPTPYLDALPYTRRIVAALDSVVGRSRLMRIEEEGHLEEHVDTNYYWRDHLRVHVPVVTSPDVEFVCAGESVHMGAGEVWVFDTWRRHAVRNPAARARIHLVVDTVGGAQLWDWIERGSADERLVAVDGPEPSVATEVVNHAVVMTPWELEQASDALLAELDTSDPGIAPDVRRALAPFRHAWREAWARFGDAPAGRAHFGELARGADAAVVRVAPDARLPNRLLVVDAFRHHVFASAVTDLGASAAPGGLQEQVRVREPVPAEPGGTALVTIDRPIFIVSSPRSGSSLLFETLAKAPGVVTIGGESHALIESIPSLHPSERGWESNRLPADAATPEIVDALTRAFVAELHDRDGNPVTGGVVRMLEKTPKNSLRVPFLAAAFPDARFVYLYRDPRETVSSMLDAWRSHRFVTYPALPGWDNDRWSLLLVPGWRELSGRPLAEVVTTQWATATSILLDDLEALGPDRWCVASYDRLVGDPQAEIQRVCDFCDLDWDGELAAGELPLSRHTLDSPSPDKWLRNADVLEPYWERVREVAIRAHDVFANPPRVQPVRRPPSVDRGTGAGSSRSAPAVPAPTATAPSTAEPVSFDSVHTAALPTLLADLGVSLLVSTYQSGRVIIVRTADAVLNTHFRGLNVPMGMAARPGELAIGTRNQVLLFQNQPALSPRLEPPGRHDAVYVPRTAHTTGDIRIHDLAYADDGLWAVNTRFSCLCTFEDDYSFVPRWRPPFVTALAAEDRCHLNGMALVDGAVRFVTALGTTDTAGGWRDHKTDGGVVLDVPSGEVVVGGLCMPHSPRWHDGRLWLLESGNGGIGVVDVESGRFEEVTRVPGFTRGLGFAGPYAFVGLSQVRESLFEGIPLKADGVERSCGVWVIDTRTGATAAFLRFEGIVQELFEVLVLPGIRYPEIVEPGAELIDSSFVLPDAALADVPG